MGYIYESSYVWKENNKGNRKEDGLEYYVNRLILVVNVVMYLCFV